MIGWLLFVFILVPLLELVILIWIGRQIDVLPTVALVVGTGVLGALLTRYQGLRAFSRFQAALSEGRLPHREVVDGFLILAAGIVLITPGILTDVVGFLLLAPAVRSALGRRLGEWLRRRVVIAEGSPRGPARDAKIIDAKFTVRETTQDEAKP